MAELRIGGVPEHFNLPWHDAIDSDALAGRVTWIDQPGGTGQMMSGLRQGDLDVAIALTEGIVAAISAGAPARIARFYTTSALQWGVHVTADSALRELVDVGSGHRYAVSRLGSGSHLMAHVLAHGLGHTVTDDRFVVVGDLDGARAALAAGDADLFLWDRFMTSPLVEAGEFRRIGVQPTPWPAFAVAVHVDVLSQRADEVTAVLDTVAAAAARFAGQPEQVAVEQVRAAHRLAADQAAEWFRSTVFDAARPVDGAVIATVIDRLSELGLVARDTKAESLIDPR